MRRRLPHYRRARSAQLAHRLARGTRKIVEGVIMACEIAKWDNAVFPAMRGGRGQTFMRDSCTATVAPSGRVAPAAATALVDLLANDRQCFFGGFLRRQGGICDIAHQLRDVVIDLLLRPDVALCNRYIDRIGVMDRSRAFADDVQDTSETVGIGAFKERLADPVADTDPSARDQDVLVGDRDAR